MSLSETEVNNLIELFKDVGFEGIGGAKPDQIPDLKKDTAPAAEETVSEPAQEEHVDDDIMALLNDKPDEPDDASAEIPHHEEDDFGFLDEPAEKTSRLSSKIKKQEKVDISPVTSHIFPETLSLHQTLSNDRVSEVFDSIGESSGGPEKDSEASFLEEEGNSASRLKSRLKKSATEEVEIIENFTFPQTLHFHQTLDMNRLTVLFKTIGESGDSSTVDVKSSYLDDESKSNSRLMSRIKQHKQDEAPPVDNNIMPEVLQFNASHSIKQIAEIFRAVGE